MANPLQGKLWERFRGKSSYPASYQDRSEAEEGKEKKKIDSESSQREGRSTIRLQSVLETLFGQVPYPGEYVGGGSERKLLNREPVPGKKKGSPRILSQKDQPPENLGGKKTWEGAIWKEREVTQLHASKKTLSRRKAYLKTMDSQKNTKGGVVRWGQGGLKGLFSYVGRSV